MISTPESTIVCKILHVDFRLFCVLTDNNLQQSIDRSGGKHGNKGIECAVSLLKMIQLQRSLK